MSKPSARYDLGIPFQVAAGLLTVTLAACGGGGDATSSPSGTSTSTCAAPAEGSQPAAAGPAVVGGTIAGRADSSFILFNASNAERIMVYGPDLAAAPVISGYVQAETHAHCVFGPSGADMGAYNGGDTSARRYDPVYLRTTVDPSVPMISGSIRYLDGATYVLSGGPLPGAASTFAVGMSARVADVAGDWRLTDLYGNVVALTVGADGGLSGHYLGCAFTGALRPAAAGMSQFDVQFSPLDASCWVPVADTPFWGLAIAYPLAAGGWQMLLRALASPKNYIDDAPSLLAIGRR